MQAANYEKLGAFYLGRYHDLQTRKTLPAPVLYEANDLLTHALCVGMTGSGKTGLCVGLIEEAAIDGIPAILIDPKGDLANLLLSFPDLKPGDFEPWVNPDDARQQGLSIPQLAERESSRWRDGLAAWDQTGERIARLRQAADFAVYTPGSNAGIPVSILSSFAVPPASILDDDELLGERVSNTVASVLGLLGIVADPLRSREAVLLSNILQSAWTARRGLDLVALVDAIQNPGFTRIGVMDLENFYPAKERFELAMSLNTLLASPGFASWLKGRPMDIQQILFTPEGRPRIAVFSIAHLSETERMFVVTLLLHQVLGWMRGQTGTTSLRALLYMDEIMGYFPPIANPPSKKPLLTLLKQARAYGVGVVLATQNPVDLDYKGLANIGTWFLGRLQTDRDKQRVLEGLEGAALSQGSGFDRNMMEQTLSSLGKRIFLLHNVHEDAPALFETRWTLSYLRGPMTRDQIRSVMAGRITPEMPATRPSSAPAGARLRVSETAPAAETATRSSIARPRPVLPPAITQVFVPGSGTVSGGEYSPYLVGSAVVRFVDLKMKVDITEDRTWLIPVRDQPIPVIWEEAEELEIDISELRSVPEPGISFGELSPPLALPANYAKWSKDFAHELQAREKLSLFRSLKFDAFSIPDETEGEFRVRLQQRAKELRDERVANLRAKYAPKMSALRERIRRAELASERESLQAQNAKVSTVVSVASTLLGAFLGRKTFSATNVSRAGSSLRGVGRAIEQSKDVERANENVEALRREIADLDEAFTVEANDLEQAYDPSREIFEKVEIKPKRTGVQIRLLALAWVT